jgi:hypothetical protein
MNRRDFIAGAISGVVGIPLLRAGSDPVEDSLVAAFDELEQKTKQAILEGHENKPGPYTDFPPCGEYLRLYFMSVLGDPTPAPVIKAKCDIPHMGSKEYKPWFKRFLRHYKLFSERIRAFRAACGQQ